MLDTTKKANFSYKLCWLISSLENFYWTKYSLWNSLIFHLVGQLQAAWSQDLLLTDKVSLGMGEKQWVRKNEEEGESNERRSNRARGKRGNWAGISSPCRPLCYCKKHLFTLQFQDRGLFHFSHSDMEVNKLMCSYSFVKVL